MYIHIGTETFKTKKSACDFVRTKINEIGCGDIEPSNFGIYTFFTSLLENHPESYEKIGTGIKYFRIQNAPMFGKQLMVVRQDDTDAIFSWKACCGVVHNDKHYVSMKCRDAIKFDMFNMKIDKQCESCGEPNNLHAHHDTVSFKTIVETFIEKYGMDACSKFIRNEQGIPCFTDDMKQNFISHHNAVCKMKVLCDICHKNFHSKSPTIK